ncbi:MAG TPA: hypothetical protein VK452_06545 [Dissulfurispiraceae bacterium]|nr:hypothetical protein [Dissulfurispiraceae bacterium]
MKPILVRRSYMAIISGFLVSSIISLFIANSALATDVSKPVNKPQSGKLSTSTEATAPYKYNADDLQLMIRIIDLSRLIAVNGPIMEKAIRVKGLTPDNWTLDMMGVSSRNMHGWGANTINVPGLGNANDAGRWTDTMWRPALKQQFGLLGLKVGEGPLPSCASTNDTVQTARQSLWTITAGDPSADPFASFRSGVGDPRIGSGFYDSFKHAVGKLWKKMGGKTDVNWDDEPSGGGGVRGQPVPEGGSGGSVAPDTKSIWWLLINMGSRWGRINSAMGQPKPVDPGIDPSTIGVNNHTIKNPKDSSIGDPHIINPNPEKPQTKDSHGSVPSKIDSKGKTPTPDPIEPTGTPSVPLPGKGGSIPPK